MSKTKKIMAVLLVIAALLPVLPQISFAETPAIEVVSDKEVYIDPSSSTVLQVQSHLSETLVWQIYVPEQDVWADIQGKTGEQCEVNNALLHSALNENDTAQLRCRAGEEFSEEFTVTVLTPMTFAHPSESSGVPELTDYEKELLDAAQNPENEQTKQITVTVQYLFYKNQQPVAAASTHVVDKAHGVTIPVSVPQILGYSAFFQGVQIKDESIQLDISEFTGDTTVIIYYNAADVKYVVNHHWQNVDNDSYVKHESVEHRGPTDAQVGLVENEYTGFKALLYERPIIAADGSTIVDVFYDRCYYLMNFNLGEGGYGVYPIYARYEAKVDIGTPVRAGYTFIGWNPTVPAMVGAENKTYTAVWKMADTAQVSVVLWGEHANDEHYGYLDTYLHTAKPGTEVHVTEKGLLTCTEHVHDENCTYNCNEEYHVHTAACCDIPAHTHSPACCPIPTYTHTEGCFGNCTHKVHTAECYGSTGESTPNNTDMSYINKLGAETGYVYRVSRDSNYNGYVRWYLYLNDTWYSVPEGVVGEEDMVDSGTSGWFPQYDYAKYKMVLHCTHTHEESCLSCTKVMHTHGDGNCKDCDRAVHVHTQECEAKCGKGEHTHEGCILNCAEGDHTHTDSCYTDLLSGMVNKNDYYFVRSTEVTVLPDGSTVLDVYYDRTEFTMTFRKTSSNGGGVLGTIKAKWGQYIRNDFQAISNANTFLWSAASNGNSPWTSFINEMPNENRTYYAYDAGTSSNVQKATYYGEVVGTPMGEYVEVDGVKYEPLFTTAVKYKSNLTVSAEEFEKIDGYAFNQSISTKTGASYNGAKFYYNRQRYEIDFNDGYQIVESESMDYGESLAEHAAHTPSVPKALDQNGYYFAGWYLNPECSGEQFDLSKETMPAKDLILYAKWEPKTHRVEFFKDNSLKEQLESHDVLHNKTLQGYPQNVTNGNLTFLYWFYMDGDTERAFDPENMPIVKDMKVYAKWSNNALRPCLIYYKTKDGQQIAETTVWIADLNAGSVSKTFEAKGPSELYDGYQHDWFPEVRSHTLNVTMESDNTFTFYYTKKENVPYTVRYLEKDTGNELHSAKVVTDNRHAAVTETSVHIPGYQADAYQKRLVVVANETDEFENELVFYYTKSDVHTEFVQVTHYIETLNGAWMEYSSNANHIPLNQSYTAAKLSISGFTYVEPGQIHLGATSNPSGVATAGGIHLKLYYKRNEYHYVVRHLRESDNQPLLEEEKSAEPVKFESLVTANAKNSIAYNDVVYVPSDMHHYTVSIRHEENPNEPVLNVITFYYEEQTTQFNYVIVGSAGCGSLTAGSERVPMYSGVAAGSTAIANEGFKFDGWFYDEACTLPVNDKVELIVGNQLTPAKKEGQYLAQTFYAKFSETYASLTIQNVGASDLDPSQSFLYLIKSEDGTSVNLKVAIIGNGFATIHNLPAGKYTVTQVIGWSWRYEPVEMLGVEPSVVITLSGGEAGSLVVENSRQDTKWLDGNHDKENHLH